MRMVARNRSVLAPLAVLAASLGGCMQVPRAPVDLPAQAASLAAAQFDPAAVAREAERIGPGTQAIPDRLDRLSLFAALLLDDPRIAQARAAIATARQEAASARKAASPTLTLTTEYANDPSTSSPWLFGGAVDLPLDLGGRRAARLDNADLAVMQARYDYAETVWAERMALRQSLIDLFAARAELPLLGDLLALQDRKLAALERRAGQGEIARLELYPARSARASTARMLEDAKAREAQARGDIAGRLGLPAAALDDAVFAWEGFSAPAPDTPAIGAQERANAAAARADVLKALVAYDRTEADVGLEVARQYPAISIGPGYTWERGLVKLPFAINLSLPSFDLNRSAIRAAVARRDEAGAAIETALSSAESAIEAALAEQRAARDSLARIRDGELPPAEATAAHADDQLAQGAISRVEWADAKIGALEAKLAAIQAILRVRQADAALEDAMRRPLEGPETAIDTSRIGEQS